MTDVLEDTAEKGSDMPCAGCADKGGTIPVAIHEQLVYLHGELTRLRQKDIDAYDPGPPVVVKVLLTLYVVALVIAVVKMLARHAPEEEAA